MRVEDSSWESVGGVANAAANARRDERIAPGGDDRIAPGDESFSGAEKKQSASDGAGGALGALGGRRLVAWAVAVLSAALIAVSAWFLLQPAEGDGVSAEGAQASQDASLGASSEGRGSAEGNSSADVAAGDASGSSSAEDSTSASGLSGGSSAATAGVASSGGTSSAFDSGAASGSSASSASGSSSAGSVGSAGSSASAGSSGSSSADGSSASSSSRDTITISVSVSSSEADGSVSASARPTFERGATAYDALCATGLSVNAQNTAFGIYVAAIGGLAEKDWGGASGWKYYVNGVDPSVSCGNYVLEDGDVVEWRYRIDGTARG